MKRGTTLLLLLASAGIIGLLGLAAYLTIYIMDDSVSSSPNSALSSIAASEDPAKSYSISPTEYGENGYQEPEHAILFVGDSRTIGMRDAVNQADSSDSCTYIAKEGEGYLWFSNEGMPQLEESLSQNPSQTVILNLGVNDLEEIHNYLNLYTDLFRLYPQTLFYIMSVNPIDESKFDGVTNEEIQSFNQQMLEAFPDKYLDCYTYLLSEDYSTVDGLHYTESTYRNIHHFAVMVL